ncbi:hypothetical protein NFHSH190041_33930 [Shewanella sp. NFH-SH190041]|uniref:DUF4124 domain-containing protein n=1 Tax=Shewanella sp. NFH-SH190041 TaxID=2950245 RepID=UPI0021C3BC31|nr:DUF4124 domain-containing protein [Shewanella sp. NFH-SH190041]BDM65941.1 hypothetical protein NFHSH190041_33930 [Shewanella sp. NFH-SH190041]
MANSAYHVKFRDRLQASSGSAVMMLITVFAMSLLTQVTAQAAVYKWIDKQGRVHYSDTPREDASVVTPAANTENRIALPQQAQRESLSPAITATQYQLTITTPEPEATIRNNKGDFTVQVAITPSPPTSTRFQLLLDNKLLLPPQRSPLFQLRNVDRGAHQIQVQSLLPDGRILANSASHTVFLHRAIHRPPKKPQPRQ